MVGSQNRFLKLLEFVCVGLAIIAAAEWFKASTKSHYEWFHCTVHSEEAGGNSVVKLWSVGGPSCDKRGELKSIIRHITRNYDPNIAPAGFCLTENTKIPARHYPIGPEKGDPAYVAYASYLDDESILHELCNESTIYHM